MILLAVAVPGPAALTIFGPQLCLGKCPKEESALPKKRANGVMMWRLGRRTEICSENCTPRVCHSALRQGGAC